MSSDCGDSTSSRVGSSAADMEVSPPQQQHQVQQQEQQQQEQQEKQQRQEQVVLALVEGTGANALQLGAAYFDARESSLSVLGRTSALGNDVSDVVQALLAKVRPTVVVIRSTARERFAATVERLALGADADDSSSVRRGPGRPAAEPSVVRFGSAPFDAQSARRRLEDLGFSSVAQLSLGAAVGAGGEGVLGLSAVGGALHFAQREGLLGDGALTRIDLTNLEDYMLVDLESLHSLDVVREERHPSVVRGNNKRKEGFSLITLLDRAKSTPGRKTLRRWILQPLANADMITDRLDAVSYLMTASAAERHADLLGALRGLRDVVGILARVRHRTAKANDWMAFAESVCAITELLGHVAELERELVAKRVETPELVAELLACGAADGVVQGVATLLAKVDWEETRDNQWLIPVAGVSPDLDKARARYAQVDALLDRMRAPIQQMYAPSFASAADLEPTYIPILGFLVSIASDDLECAGKGTGKKLPADFEELFVRTDEAQNILYFRCDATRQLDERYGDLHGAVRDLEEKALRELEDSIMEAEHEVARATAACGALDVLLAFAATALDFEYSRPKLVSDTTKTVILGASHPLLVHNVEQYVPNDFRVGGDGPGDKSVILVTGCNYSGKSAALKTFATIVIMAQIGCFVPAERATIGIVDRLFTRVETLESSASAMESTFSIDVQQVAHMVKNCTPRSLLLIDEFGKGTAPLDGASLLVATIKRLCEGPAASPRTFLTTHFLEVLDGVILGPSRNKLLLCEMQVMIDDHDNDHDHDADADGNGDVLPLPTPVPLFHLVAGSKTCKSYALACGSRANVPADVLRRAQVVLTLSEQGMAPSTDAAADEHTARLLQRIEKTDWASASADDIQAFIDKLPTQAQAQAQAQADD